MCMCVRASFPHAPGRPFGGGNRFMSCLVHAHMFPSFATKAYRVRHHGENEEHRKEEEDECREGQNQADDNDHGDDEQHEPTNWVVYSHPIPCIERDRELLPYPTQD